jgi:pilus assembly protein Flp/PilA
MEKLQEKLLDCFVRFNNEDGQGMVEYALILFLISIVAIVFLTQIGADVSSVYNTVEDALGGGNAT